VETFARLAVLLAFLVFVIPACESMPAGSVLFQDDFSDPSSGWVEGEDSLGKTEYGGGGLRITVSSSKSGKISVPRLKFTDVSIDADAIKVAGPDDNAFGLICRYKDEENFYFLEISSDGYYGIGKSKDGDLTLLGTDQMQSSDAIRQGKVANHIRAECVGQTLTLYTNGVKLAQVEDADLAEGDVGVVAVSFGTPGVEVSFDNFSVTRP
jgi:hypothetical protein